MLFSLVASVLYFDVQILSLDYVHDTNYVLYVHDMNDQVKSDCMIRMMKSSQIANNMFSS
jgi:hypothetical protein